MSKITLSGHIEVPSEDLDAVLAELPNHIALTHQEAGCITFTVTRDSTNPQRFSVYEEFTDKAAFEKHQARVKASHWGEVTKNVERFYTITEN
ncbi:putative quinol monooxygenase [Marinomonas polaris]|jgi:quinol monooxygenase YgiN|uniref:putative quinol monooxygenase n=1 Tax=Marinomonas TaxID=28253 RepID=UPI000C1EEDF6|nr:MULTISPECIES: putative quinol monooxygenase [unclassified Marinomonas]MBU1296835.1 antibiotic biosynthesis monooxygenase [Gammaproteobacteria bacterium]MBU1467018.1 antibiotic biosynthesis monooxygenase [Gammaproteobacteria bacterium]PJE56508.1 antibiotic biosynthesis monooxygenase [Marinomonas sp. BSi20584]